MITKIADPIVATLEDLAVFRAVERSIKKSILQTPPGAAVILAYDREVVNKPVDRELGFDIMLTIPALSKKGQTTADDLIDKVRNTFIGWRPFTTGGVIPAKVPRIQLEGIQGTVMVYSVRVTMEVIPQIIDRQ